MVHRTGMNRNGRRWTTIRSYPIPNLLWSLLLLLVVVVMKRHRSVVDTVVPVWMHRYYFVMVSMSVLLRWSLPGRPCAVVARCDCVIVDDDHDDHGFVFVHSMVVVVVDVWVISTD